VEFLDSQAEMIFYLVDFLSKLRLLFSIILPQLFIQLNFLPCLLLIELANLNK